MNGTTIDVSESARTPFEYIGHILYIIEGSGMVFTNGLIILTMVGHKSMRKNQMHNMIALALGDGVYGTGIFTGGVRRLWLVVTRTDRVQMSAWSCMLKFPTIFYIAGSQMTALAMVLISIDRYIAAAHTAWYMALDGFKQTMTLILTVVGFGAITSGMAIASSYFGWGGDTHEVRWAALCLSTWAVPSWYATGYTTFVAVGGYLSIAVYAMVLLAYRKYARTNTVSDQNSNLPQIKLQRERRVTITMAFVTLMTLLFHSIPYTIILATTLFQLKSEFVSVLNPFLWCLVCFNSLANIFVYLKRHRDIRAAMYDVIHGRFKSIAVYPISAARAKRIEETPNNTTRF